MTTIDLSKDGGLEAYLSLYAGGSGKKKKKGGRKKARMTPRSDSWVPAYQFAVIEMGATGKARPRVTKNGTFMPTAYTEKSELLRRLFGEVTVTPPLAIGFTVCRKMPDGWSAKKKRKRVGTFALPTPDVDNSLGWLMDTLMKDDSAVVAASPVKIWGYEAQLVIHLLEVDELQVWRGLIYENDKLRML